MTIDTQSFSTRRRVNSLAVDRIDEKDYQINKLAVGDENEVTLVSETNPLPVEIISGGGGGGSGTEFAEDAAHSSGALGTLALAVRRDADTSLVDASGDYAPLQVNANGALKVEVIETVGGGGGGASATDDAAFTVGSGTGTPIMGYAGADNVDANDVGVLRMTAARALHVDVQNTSIPVTDNGGSLTVDGSVSVTDGGGTISIDDGAGSITVDGTVAATQSGTWNIGSITTLPTLANVTTVGTVSTVSAVSAVTPGTGATNLGKAEDAAHASGDTGVLALGVRQDTLASSTSADGDYAALKVSSAGRLYVDAAITSGAGSGGTSIADNATFTRGTTSETPIGGVVETSAPTLTNGNVGAISLTTGGAVRVSVASGGIAGVLEDAASAGGEEGILAMAVRQDTLSSTTSADGDFTYLKVNSNGALHVTGGGGGTQYVIDAAAGAADTGTLSLAVRDDTLATLTPVDNDYTQFRTNARGALWVALDSTAAQTVTLAASTATQEIVGDAATDAAVSGNPVYIAGRGNNATPTAMSAANDVTPLWLTLNGSVVVAGDTIDDSAFTPGTTRVQAVGYHADETSSDSVDEGDLGAARMTLDRKQIVTMQPHTQGGLLIYSATSTNTAQSVKASAGQLYGYAFYNPNATAAYVQIFNVASGSVTVGTTAPTYSIGIPATSGANLMFPNGVAHSTAISVASTTTRAGGTAPTTALDVNLWYF